MKLLSHARWILGTTLVTLLAAGCGGTEGTSSTASPQVVPATAPAAGRAHRRGPPDPARLAEHLDRNHDGRIEVAELPERARERMATADADRDGVITTPELNAHMAQMQAQHFARLDPNGDGAVTAAEVEPARWAHLQAADADHDGRVTRDELQAARASGALRGPGRGRFGGGPRGPHGGPGGAPEAPDGPAD